MNRSLKDWVFIAALLAAATACDNEVSAPAETKSLDSDSRINVLANAPTLIRNAMDGSHARGEQEEMLKLESVIPGFGGFVIDENGNVVIMLRNQGGLADDSVRKIVAQAYANRVERRVRELMAPAISARIQAAQFSLAELVAVENRIATRLLSIPGVVGVGTSIRENRVKVGFVDSTSMVNGTSVLDLLAIPRVAIIKEVWGEPHLTADFSSKVRPVRGGLALSAGHIVHGSTYWETPLSVGFNVKSSSGVKYFMSAAHGVNQLYATNGGTGYPIYQPKYDAILGNQIGTVAHNPLWKEGSACPVDSASGAYPTYCTEADVFLGSYSGGTSGEAKVATSMNEGLNGKAGSQQINNYYPIDSVLSPELVRLTTKGIHKSGQTTGTTTGEIDLPLTQFALAQFGWGTDQAPPKMWVSMIYYNVTKVKHIGWGEGDSGGAVFAGNGSPYQALGIQFAGSGSSSGFPLQCNAGTACAIYFARWDKIESALGFSISPVTAQY